MSKSLQKLLDPGKRPGRLHPLGLPPPVECVDGFTMCVDASAEAYSLPRNNFGPWTHLEVYNIGVYEPWSRHRMFPMDGLCACYGYVPIEDVEILISEHGGLK